MELSVHFVDFLPGAPDRLAPTVTQAAVAAEEAGATMLTLADHFFQMEEMGRAQDHFSRPKRHWDSWSVRREASR